LARCATAFGVKEVIIVSRSRDMNTFGSHGAHDFVNFRHFPRLEDMRAYLKGKGVEIIGVEICEGAQPVHTRPFTGPTAFMMGNEGDGFSEKQMEYCDRFVYIAQHGPGTASLNVAVAASIVLHQFTTCWAGYPERGREGYKFIVDDRPALRRGARGSIPLTEEEVAAKRAARAAQEEGGDEGEGFGGDLFDE
jgi:tRNA(Leu) C34 or U34 (ribose-2'-O)-methylase TrmL